MDLIMMPTHGLGFFRNYLIGSVTAKVLHDARCPVWTATHAEEQRSRQLPKAALCAVDGKEGTLALIRWAGEFSKQMGASLKLLHVVPPISDWLELASERDLQEQLREEARSKLRVCQESSGVDVTVRVAVGPIAATVAEEASQEGADLVIIGRGSLRSPLGRLRTHAYGIIQKSPCPVLSL
jgi:nucleotide-binding universal stress UspA family protein